MQKYDDDKIKEIKEFVKNSLSIAEVCRKMGIRPAGGNYKILKNCFNINNIDTSHFTGQGWNVGERYKYFGKRYELDEILVEKSTYTCNDRLKIRLINSGLKKYKCEECGLTEWNGKKISLHLDHKNGNNLDNRIENLRLLCPNCHSQTETYCNSKIICNSSELKKKRFENKNKLEQNIEKIKIIKNKTIKPIKIINYCECGKEIDKRSKQCKSCVKKQQKRKVEKRPSIDELVLMVKELGYRETGKKYNVSDNTIRKWIKMAV
jgi:transposase-like protein/Zn finger protein HypA/HybF involved in hydrogenase expression